MKDHRLGKIKIAYIATVSQNNLNRALHTQWLAYEMCVSDIPIISCDREKVELNGAEINRCIFPWEWTLNGN